MTKKNCQLESKVVSLGFRFVDIKRVFMDSSAYRIYTVVSFYQVSALLLLLNDHGGLRQPNTSQLRPASFRWWLNGYGTGCVGRGISDQVLSTEVCLGPNRVTVKERVQSPTELC